MIEERKRPIKQFRAVKSFGPYRVGDKLQPTGLYRDVLIKRGLIEEIKDEPAFQLHSAQPEVNRMIPAAALANRGGRRR